MLNISLLKELGSIYRHSAINISLPTELRALACFYVELSLKRGEPLLASPLFSNLTQILVSFAA
jgi:hypothetical protein